MPPSHAELVGRTRELLPKIAAFAAEAEVRRSVVPEVLSDLIDAELMQLLTPRRWGGHEGRLTTFIKVVDLISSACMSTGWNTSFYIGHNLQVTRFPERAQEEMFGGKSYGLISGSNIPVSARRVHGGWIISGEAPYASGVVDGNWVLLLGKADDQSVYWFAIPREDYEMLDVWNVIGMSATGSNTIKVTDLFVPDHRVITGDEFSMGGIAKQLYSNPLYHIPMMPFLLCEVVPVLTGGLRGASEAFQQVIRGRMSGVTRRTTADDPRSHVLMGDAQLNTMVADRLCKEIVDSIERGMNSGQGLPVGERIRLKAIAAYITNLGRNAMNEMIYRAGSSAFHVSRPLQHFFRDINMVSTHVFCDFDIGRELIGRHSLGLEPNYPNV